LSHRPPPPQGTAAVAGRRPALDPAARRLASSPRASFFPGCGGRGGCGSLFDPTAAAPTPTVARRLPPSSSRPRRRRPEIRPQCDDSLPTRVTAQAPGGAAEVRRRRTEQCGRRVVVVASLAWGTEDRRPAAAWSWPDGGGPRPALLFSFFYFLCREYLGGARQRAGDAVSLGTAVDPFSLSCVTFCARQRPMPCVAVPYGERQWSLPGKNAPCVLCSAPGQNPHRKGCAVRVLACASGSATTTRRVHDLM
jgi:hypothetical protein